MHKSTPCWLLLMFVLIFSVPCFGQSLLTELPTTKEEFIESEKKVLATIDWLESTPFDEQTEKRKQQTALLVGWITNSPTVTVGLHPYLLNFVDNHPELLVTFMGGWTKYVLQNNYDTDELKAEVAGLKSVLKVYSNFSLEKDNEIENILKLEKKGKLEKWIKKNR